MILVGAFHLRVFHDCLILGQCGVRFCSLGWSHVGEEPELWLCWGRALEWPPLGGGRGTGKVAAESHGPVEEEKGLVCN